MKYLTVLLLASAGVPAMAQPAGPQSQARRMESPPVRIEGTCAIVPMRLMADIPTVEVMLGGRGPYRFAIDTGAQGHGRITAALAQWLGLPTVGEARTPAPGGTVATRPIFGMPEIRLGELVFRDARFLAAPDIRGVTDGLDGILGVDLFRELTLVVDYANGRAGARQAGLSGGVAADFSGPVPTVPIEVAGRGFNVTLDIGNGAAQLFLREEAARLLPHTGPAVQRGRARTSFGEFAVMEAPIDLPVTLGGTALDVRTVGWPTPRGEGNLGSRAFTGRLLEVGRRGGRVAVSMPPAPAACPR